MALPEACTPYVTSARRCLFLAEKERRRTSDTGPADAFRQRRLAQAGTTLPATFPSRTLLLAAGVLAVEEVLGAGVDELRSYGLSLRQAESLVLFTEGYTMTTFGYGPRAGQFYEEDEVSILASAARTTSGNSDVYEVGDKGTLRLDLDVTAVSGSGTVHVQIETRKAYGSGDWRVVDAFPVASAVGSQRRSMSGCDRFVRAVYTISGTSVTFSLTGEAV